MYKIFASVFLVLVVSACSSLKTEGSGRPMSRDDAVKESRGKLTGDGGLLSIGGSGGNDAESGGGSSPIGVNSYLWRATLDTLSFMPLVSADPFGGVILTDWFEDPKTVGERFKVTAIILDKTLRADGIKIKAFKQKQEKGIWRDQAVDETLSRQIEDTILTRARQLKIAQGK